MRLKTAQLSISNRLIIAADLIEQASLASYFVLSTDVNHVNYLYEAHRRWYEHTESILALIGGKELVDNFNSEGRPQTVGFEEVQIKHTFKTKSRW